MVETNSNKAPWLKLAYYGTELPSAKNVLNMGKTSLGFSMQERALKETSEIRKLDDFIVWGKKSKQNSLKGNQKRSKLSQFGIKLYISNKERKRALELHKIVH